MHRSNGEYPKFSFVILKRVYNFGGLLVKIFFGENNTGSLAVIFNNLARIKTVGGLIVNCQIHQSLLLPKVCVIP